MHAMGGTGMRAHPDRGARRARGWLIAIAIALLAAFALATAYALLERYFPNWRDWWPKASSVSIAQIEQYIHDSGRWGMAVSIGLMVAHSFIPLPSEPIALANGMIYGAAIGGTLTWVGAMLGAQAAYWPGRILGHVAVARHVGPDRLARLTRWIESGGVLALLGVRLIPMISFNAINYVAGFAHVPWWTFTWTTAVGILPLTVLLALLGESASAMAWETWLAVAGASVLFLVLVWWIRKR